MAYSEVEIVNIALNSLGKESIRSFSVSDDDPKSGRLAERLYTIARDSLISNHDWSFARKTVQLRKLTETHVEGVLYALPSDCFVPRRLYPRGGLPNKFRIEENRILIPFTSCTTDGTAPNLRYTRKVSTTGLFPPYFIDALSAALAARLCMPMTRDKKFHKELKADARTAFMLAARTDANADSGDDYIDLDVQHDSFIDPDATGVMFDG